MKINDVLEIVRELIEIPSGFEAYLSHEAKHDDETVIVLRFIKADSFHEWGGEHFTVTFNPESKKLKGFIHLEEKFETDEIPTEEEAEKIAFSFLGKYAPDLIDTTEVRWVRPLRKIPISSPHDDGFMLASGKIIIGMRVKLFINSNQKYGWVIVGKDGHVINFERDIEWSTLKKCRTTERWLHDAWAKENINLVQVV